MSQPEKAVGYPTMGATFSPVRIFHIPWHALLAEAAAKGAGLTVHIAADCSTPQNIEEKDVKGICVPPSHSMLVKNKCLGL